MLNLKFSIYNTLRYNSLLEVVWNILPILCLCWIAIPSFSLLYMLDEATTIEFIIRIMGNQWYWTYEFTVLDTDIVESNYVYNITEISENFDLFKWLSTHDVLIEDIKTFKEQDVSNVYLTLTFNELFNEGEFRYKFDSRIIVEDDLVSDNHGFRLLEVDQRLNILENITTCFLISSTDVLHSWAVPSFGVKSDACPGRLNKIIVSINRLGVYYGQCSEICGIYHAFMPIVVTVSDSLE